MNVFDDVCMIMRRTMLFGIAFCESGKDQIPLLVLSYWDKKECISVG